MNGRTAERKLGLAGRRRIGSAVSLSAAALLALGACSGEDGSMLEIVGSLEGERFADEHHEFDESDDHVGEPEKPAAAAPKAGKAPASTDAAGPVVATEEPADAAEGPARDPVAAPASGHDPNDGVKAVRPANLPEGLRYLAFDDVAWPDYEPLDMRDVDAEAYGSDEFPAEVARLNGARVAFDGYMVPVDFENRRVTSFILSRYLPGCCFGVMPRMDEWIEVEVKIDGGVEYFPYQIVRVTGTFEVGEMLDDYGYVRSIYRIKADEVDEQL